MINSESLAFEMNVQDIDAFQRILLPKFIFVNVRVLIKMYGSKSNQFEITAKIAELQNFDLHNERPLTL